MLIIPIIISYRIKIYGKFFKLRRVFSPNLRRIKHFQFAKLSGLYLHHSSGQCYMKASLTQNHAKLTHKTDLFSLEHTVQNDKNLQNNFFWENLLINIFRIFIPKLNFHLDNLLRFRFWNVWMCNFCRLRIGLDNLFGF